MNRAVIVGARGRHGYHPAGRAGSDVAQVDAAVVQEDVMSHAVSTKLTGLRPRRTIQKMVRRIRMIVSGLVAAGIFATGVATCTAGAMMPETAQMACCKAGH